jgi:hypothetical protein
MRVILIIIFQSLLFSYQSIAQVYPSFGPEILVNINGLTFDAM